MRKEKIMGKVIRSFRNGYPGAVSRSADDIIISMRNASGAKISFGAPVFLAAGENACCGFDADVSAPAAFLGFAVRVADKTPDTYGSSEGAFLPGDPVDILVRGSTVLAFEGAAAVGNSVYIRKSDGRIVTSAGSEGTTVQLPNVAVRTPRDSGRCAEVTLAKRNLL